MKLLFRHLSDSEKAAPKPGELLICQPPGVVTSARNLAELALQRGPAAFPQGAGQIAAVVLPVVPTLDDLLAAEFVSRQVVEEKLPAGCQAFARYVGLVREGLRPSELPLETSLEGVYLAMLNAAGENLETPPAVAKFAADWPRLANRILAAAAVNVDPFIQPFLAEGSEFARERTYLRHDQDVFREDVQRGEQWTVQIPGGPPNSYGLLLRNPKSLLFKYWSRDSKTGRDGKPYLFLAIDWGAGKWVFSTDPVRRLPLAGLHQQLQAAEAAANRARATEHSWFDGDAFDHTLIAAPKDGTALTDEEVLKIVRRWTQAKVLQSSTSRRHRKPWIAVACVATLLLAALAWWRLKPVATGNIPAVVSRGAETLFAGNMPAKSAADRGIVLEPVSQQIAEGQRWAVVIGINKYINPEMPKLNYSVNDAKLISSTLIESGGYDKDNVLLISDDQPDPQHTPWRENLRTQVSRFLELCNPGDMVFVFFAGHGENADHVGYLLPIDARPDDPGTWWRTDELRGMLHDCRATRKILVLDCCHAGTGERDAVNKPIGPSSAALGEEFLGSQGLITLASCKKDQTSKEWPEKQHGLFSYYLAEGLSGAADDNHDGIVDSFELYRYLVKKVPAASVRELNGSNQTPVLLSGDDSAGIFALTRVKPDPAPATTAVPMASPAANLQQK